MTCVSSVGIIKSKKTMMKKEYVKPNLEIEEILLEGMLANSKLDVDPDGPGTNESDANDRRGSWGDFWN